MDSESNVVEFPQPKTVEGQARCMNCQRVWQAVVSFPSRRLPIECPDCHQLKGVLTMPYMPDGHQVWKCDCENDMFFVLREGIYCPNCGKFSQMPDAGAN
jgi:Zn finger protein HypA/HybF involved in hydrogenase expression